VARAAQLAGAEDLHIESEAKIADAWAQVTDAAGIDPKELARRVASHFRLRAAISRTATRTRKTRSGRRRAAPQRAAAALHDRTVVVASRIRWGCRPSASYVAGGARRAAQVARSG
jgi:hypothetical protein